MSNTSGIQARRLLKIIIALAPWVAAMYLFYWLDSSGTWTSDTAHRGKLSVIILSTGMILSFLVWSRFEKLEKQQTRPKLQPAPPKMNQGELS